MQPSVNVQADHAKHIREVGAASAVLVKNNNALPLSNNQVHTIAVIGEDAKSPKSLNRFGDHGGMNN